jgi:hypothetical protein
MNSTITIDRTVLHSSECSKAPGSGGAIPGQRAVVQLGAAVRQQPRHVWAAAE